MPAAAFPQPSRSTWRDQAAQPMLELDNGPVHDPAAAEMVTAVGPTGRR
jgi:hypothetical protein